MMESNDNIINPGGNPSGNPRALKATEPQSDSGRGSSLRITEPAIDHLVVGVSRIATSELSESKIPDTLEGKVGLRRISDRMKGMQINTAIENDFILSESTIEIEDSETDKRFMEETDKTGKKKTGKSKKREYNHEAKSAYKKAIKFLKSMKVKNPNNLTDRERKFIRRSKKVVKKYKKEQRIPRPLETTQEQAITIKKFDAPPEKRKEQDQKLQRDKIELSKTSSKKGKTSKRIHSDEGKECIAKKPKLSMNFKSPEEFQMAIIDRSDPDGRMSSERWLEVEAKILTEIAERREEIDEDELCFDGVDWQMGVKVIGCSNKQSYDFLKRVVCGFGELWQEAKLEVVPKSDLPLRQIISVWIPPPVPENDEITLKIISKQNKDLNTESWRIISSATSKSGSSKNFVIAVDEESFKYLQNSKRSIKFGLGILKIRLHNKKSKNQNSETVSDAD